MPMPANKHPLAPVFAQLSALGAVRVRYQPGPLAEPLAECVATPWLSEQLAVQTIGRPNLDQRAQGAFFIGRLSYLLGLIWAASLATAGNAPKLDHCQVTWQADQVVVTLNDCRLLSFAELRTHIIAVMTPIIAHVREQTRLSPGAQWGLVSDSLASAWLTVGQHLGQEHHAQAQVMELLHGDKSRLRNRRTGFERYQAYLGSALLGEQVVRTRAGCCRKYTDDGEYCATCVHLTDEQRRQRLEPALWQTHDPTHIVVQR